MSEINTYNIGNHDGKVEERQAWRAEVERIRKEIEADNEHDPDTGWSPDVFVILRRLIRNMEACNGKL